MVLGGLLDPYDMEKVKWRIHCRRTVYVCKKKHKFFKCSLKPFSEIFTQAESHMFKNINVILFKTL